MKQKKINPKIKGNLWETNWASWFRGFTGMRAWRDPQSGGGDKEKGDVGNNLDQLHEVKARKQMNVQKFFERTSKLATGLNKTPVLILHYDGMPEGKFLVVMDNEDWAEMLVKSLEEREQLVRPVEGQEARDMRYQIGRTKTELGKLDKLLR